eukprot:CAMPEP_0201729094 /NCGR_PEP_ID=MMETSP0593-20130828/17971_1 /ASSEMBLY_ACC=CAM_ASM_000672 /TAXON_ID=267983 /ORGANISM="Skeletonema japonicum, Strain CCMP2506" /LENGTH=506 /DNA_ID=CAMNT_0048221379 /DNA_START=32 /DNA_END=1552 /DNA_ORIENTATION=+
MTIFRGISLPTTFAVKRRKKGKKQRSLPGDCEVLDDTTEEGSEVSLPSANDVLISVHDEVVQNTVSMSVAEEGPLSHGDDSGPPCFCMTDEHLLLTTLLDDFFSQQPKPAHCRQEDTLCSSSSCEEVTTRIECILQAAYTEDKEDLVENEDVMIPPQIHVSVPVGQSLPCLSEWKQQPLLLTATPNAGMTIRGIRRLCEPSSFENPVNSGHTENGSLVQLPINNGKEQPRQSWVIDFETELFAGTALFRIRDCNTDALSTGNSSIASKHDYFGDKNRKYQVCIRGRFKKPVVMATCVSGLLLDRPLVISRKVNSNAPPRWILRAAVKIANILSPRMDAELECDHPRVLSPLCSTAQTIRKHAQKEDPVHLDDPQEEPHPNSTASLVADLKKSGADESDANYAQYRKRTFNNIYDDYVQSNSNVSPHFDDSEYTFEFLQHLVDYNDLSLDLGRAMGKMTLGAGLRGQPVRIIAVSKPTDEQGGISEAVLNDTTSLWAFDLWHASNIV